MLEKQHAENDEDIHDKDKMDFDEEIEPGEIRDQDMDIDEESKEDRRKVVSQPDSPKESQKREGDLVAKKMQLAKIERAMEEAKMLNEEYVHPFFGLS
jgi:hypothetical protein